VDKEIKKQRVIDYRKKLKIKCVQYKGGKCQLCGYDKCMRALTFHHIDPTQKEFGISSRLRKWEIIKEELDKCQLLCQNCHCEVHELEFNKESNLQFLKEKRIEKEKNSTEVKCEQCDKLFIKPNSKLKRRNFCSVECKKGFFNTWPKDEELIELFKSCTIKEISVLLGKGEKLILDKRTGFFKDGRLKKKKKAFNIVWPEDKELENLLKEKTYKEVSKHIGVSIHSLVNRIKKRNIPI